MYIYTHYIIMIHGATGSGSMRVGSDSPHASLPDGETTNSQRQRARTISFSGVCPNPEP